MRLKYFVPVWERKRGCLTRWRIVGCLVVLGILMIGAELPARAADDPYDGDWHFAVTPYIWLPNINGDLRIDHFPAGPGTSADAETGPNSYLENLTFALMLSGEARKGPWAIFTDIIGLDFANQESSLKSVSGPDGTIHIPRDQNVNTETSLRGGVWTLAGSYTVARNDTATLDILAGARYLVIKTRVSWDLTSTITGPGISVQSVGDHSNRGDLIDAIIGLRGRIRFGGDWFVPYYLDFGTGESALTWQALAGIGYAFDWIDVLASYRSLNYDQSGDRLLQNIRFNGPAVAVTFHF